MGVHPQVAIMLEAMASMGAKPFEESTPAEARAMYDAIPPMAEPREISSIVDRTIPGPATELPVRIYRNGDGTKGALVFFHGGGWVIGGLDSHDGTCRTLCAEADCVVIAVDYRLAPEAKFPAAADDCLAATRWVAEHADELDIDPARIAVGGDSAGGNLAAVVAQDAKTDVPPLAMQLLIYPVTDHDLDNGSMTDNAEGYFLTRSAMSWFWDHYTKPSDRNDPRAAPEHASDVSGLAPALVITAEFDPLRDEGEAYGAKLKAAGVETTVTRYDGMIHGFFGMGAILDTANRAVAEATAALKLAIG